MRLYSNNINWSQQKYQDFPSLILYLKFNCLMLRITNIINTKDFWIEYNNEQQWNNIINSS